MVRVPVLPSNLGQRDFDLLDSADVVQPALAHKDCVVNATAADGISHRPGFDGEVVGNIALREVRRRFFLRHDGIQEHNTRDTTARHIAAQSRSSSHSVVLFACFAGLTLKGCTVPHLHEVSQ